MTPEIVDTKTVSADDLLIHDEKSPEPSLAFLLSRMCYPDFPEPLAFSARPNPFNTAKLSANKTSEPIAKSGPGDLQKLLTGDETWTVS